jgi:ABC-type phosphate transport system substrate-binding protein
LYVKKASLKKPAVVAFLRYFLSEGQALVAEVGYVPLSPKLLRQMRARLEAAISGDS